VEQVGKVLLFIAGAATVLVTLVSAVRTTILPRGVQSGIFQQVFKGTWVIFRLRVGRSPSYEKRDRVMAMYAPVALLTLLTAWYVLLVLSYTAMFAAINVHPLRNALELAGSSVFTLGTTSTHTLIGNLLSYSEAGLGLLLLTLLITYLPAMYTSFQRREAAVTLLAVRAGTPPVAANLIIRYHRIEKTDQLGDLWRQWEEWFADVEESHVSFPALAFFRSPQPSHSWVTAAGAVLDAAGIWVTTVEHPRDPDAQLMIRAGYLCLRQIADYWKVPYDANPQPTDPISISRSEFDEACGRLAKTGVPLKADLDAAWEAYAGWRVNYDTPLLNLARLTEAPIAPWTSDRSPLQMRVTTFGRIKNVAATTRARRLQRRVGPSS
jgi:hypothetical protein